MQTRARGRTERTPRTCTNKHAHLSYSASCPARPYFPGGPIGSLQARLRHGGDVGSQQKGPVKIRSRPSMPTSVCKKDIRTLWRAPQKTGRGTGRTIGHARNRRAVDTLEHVSHLQLPAVLCRPALRERFHNLLASTSEAVDSVTLGEGEHA